MHTIRSSVSALVFTLTRTIGKQPWVAPVFCRVHHLLPLDDVARSDHAIAIRHPRPGWAGHVVVTPTTPCRGLLSTRETLQNRGSHMWEIYALARDVAATQPEAERGRLLIINGGRRQEIGQIHGHLAPSPDAAGFPANVLEALDEGVDERQFSNAEASPSGFTEWLDELERAAPTWLANQRGFSVLLPLESGVMPEITITVDCDV